MKKKKVEMFATALIAVMVIVAVALQIDIPVKVAYAVNNVNATGPTTHRPGPAPQGKILVYNLTGVINTSLTNIPGDDGIQLPYLFNAGRCVFERSGTSPAIMNVTAQGGFQPGSSSTTLFTNATNRHGLDVNNSASTYAFSWDDELYEWFRLLIGQGFSATNLITNASCYFWFNP